MLKFYQLAIFCELKTQVSKCLLVSLSSVMIHYCPITILRMKSLTNIICNSGWSLLVTDTSRAECQTNLTRLLHGTTPNLILKSNIA